MKTDLNISKNDKNKISLTSEERETAISWSDDDIDKKLWIYTSQQPMIRKLRKNPYFELLREHKSDSYYYPILAIEGYLPVKFLTIRQKTRKYTAEQRKQMGMRLQNANKALRHHVKPRFSEKQKQIGTLPLGTTINFEKSAPNNKKRSV